LIEPVRTPDDPRIADYAHVGDPAWLREHGLFVAEGRLVVRRLIAGGRFVVKSLLLTPAALLPLTDVVEAVGCPAYVCDQGTMNTIAGYNFHRGCLALAERPHLDPPLDRFAAVSSLLALEGVGNPDNVGGLFRVAAAFDVGGVLLGPGSGDPLYRKAIRTSMGAALRVPFARVPQWPSDLERFRANGFQVVALTPDPGAIPIAHYAAMRSRDARQVLLLGAEGNGLTPAAFSAADHRVRIPVIVEVDSLNVIVAAGIVLAFLFGR
jgi:tRNA G18 (ribose-2'-O)-methylase SpoU